MGKSGTLRQQFVGSGGEIQSRVILQSRSEFPFIEDRFVIHEKAIAVALPEYSAATS